MGYYDIGEGEGIRTPGLVLAEMETVDSSAQSLRRDIAASNAPREFTSGYLAWLREWNAFYEANRSGVSAWFSRGTTPVYDKVIAYRDRLKQWLDAYRKAGGVPSRADSPEGAPKAARRLWPYVAGGAVVVALGVGIYLYTRGEARNG